MMRAPTIKAIMERRTALAVATSKVTGAFAFRGPG